MNFKHNTAEIKGISRLASAIASDDLIKVRHEIENCITTVNLEMIYEAILQSYLFCGFPAVIETLRIFNELSGGYFKEKEKFDPDNFEARGIKNCRSIYKSNFDKLISNMETFSPDIKQWMIIEGYGKVMGRSGLNLLEREFVNVAVLSTRYYENQLYSHLKGCINNGAGKEEIEEVLYSLKGIAKARNIEQACELLHSFKPK